MHDLYIYMRVCVQERSMALYIVQQYIAASGGQHALNAIESMCVIGKVKMAASEMVGGEELRVGKMKSMKQGAGELGGFVLWQKRPHLWSLELMLSGFKISAASDGALAWRQSPSRVSRGPARPLRRSLQVLSLPSFSSKLHFPSIKFYLIFSIIILISLVNTICCQIW